MKQVIRQRLLLVDDDSVSRLALKSYLIDAGYIVDEARCGQDAIKMCSTAYYPIIIMDYNMPGMNGASTTQTLRLHAATNGVIIGVTAHTNPEIKKNCLASGMDGIVSKPVAHNELLDLIAQTLPK